MTENRARASVSVLDAPATRSPTSSTPVKKKPSYKEQRELDALPTQIAALEKEQKQIADVLALDGGAVYATDATRAAALAARHAAIDDELLAVLERWDVLSAGR